MSRTVGRWLALAIASATIILMTVGILLQAAVNTFDSDLLLPGQLALSAGLSGFTIVALVIVVRLPRHPIVWVLLAVGLSWGLRQSLFGHAAYEILTGRSAGTASAIAFLLGRGMNATDLVLLTLLALLFPDGRPLSWRWGLVGWTAVVTGIYVFIWAILYPGPLPRFESVTNPIGVGVPRETMDALLLPPFLLLLLSVAGGVASLIVRLRRAVGEQRQQMKWFAYAALLFVISFALVPFGSGVSRVLGQAGAVVSAWVGATAIGIAILRYRLYEIDQLINRTLVYGATSAALAATFYGGILALQAPLRQLTLGSEIGVAASTLLCLALFQPLRRRVQNAVDRRFDRSRYDAARTLDVFADCLRDEVDLDALRGELLGAVRQTMAPAHASLWLRTRDRNVSGTRAV